MSFYKKREKERFFRRFFLLFTSFLLIFALGYTAITIAEAEEIYASVVRLHILADSDEPAEQSLKLKVRDAVLARYGDQMAVIDSVRGAEETMLQELPGIKALAEETLRANGSDHAVSVSFLSEYYPTRVYDGFSLPAGRYRSLKIEIGSGEGQNWFCMVYPPLCTASSEADEALVSAGFSESEVRFLTEGEEGYTLKFKIVEAVSECMETVKGWLSQ